MRGLLFCSFVIFMTITFDDYSLRVWILVQPKHEISAVRQNRHLLFDKEPVTGFCEISVWRIIENYTALIRADYHKRNQKLSFYRALASMIFIDPMLPVFETPHCDINKILGKRTIVDSSLTLEWPIE